MKYADYMKSPRWWKRREQWAAEWAQQFDHEPFCLVCGQPWAIRDGDLHHRTYDRLGEEEFADLVPLCRDDHTRLHRVYDSSPNWKYMGRQAATAAIIATLRRQHRERTGDTK